MYVTVVTDLHCGCRGSNILATCTTTGEVRVLLILILGTGKRYISPLIRNIRGIIEIRDLLGTPSGIPRLADFIAATNTFDKTPQPKLPKET